MSKCKRCQVEIMDDTTICPLCNTILTKDDARTQNVYPDIRNKTKWMKRFISICIYTLIVLEIIFCVINYYTFQSLSWSLISGGCIAYIICTLVYSFNRRNGHIRKIFVQAVGAFLLLLLLDYATGCKGWSVVYGMPCAVLVLDGVLVILMLVNRQNWQSYLLVQMFSLIVSMVLLLLYIFDITHNPALVWVTFGVSAIIFSFCFIIGNRTAKNELRRRFYI